MPDFELKIKETLDSSGGDKAKKDLDEIIAKSKMTGHQQVLAELDEITGKTKHAAESTEKLELSHRQLHMTLERVSPALASMARFLTSGFAGAIGVVLIAFQFLNEKLEQFKQYLQDIDTGPGARGEWAEKIRDNTREAAVEMAVLNDKLHAAAVAQESLEKITDRLIARQKEHAAAAKEVGDAQKELALARLALAEKLGQITPDQAVEIRLEIDDAAFKRQLAAELAAIQAELSARQQEWQTNQGREPGLGGAMDRSQAAALAAKNAQDKNAAKLAQDKADLETAKATAAKDEAILAAPHHYGDKADTFLASYQESVGIFWIGRKGNSR
jgi:hypothetical protein